jgi:hypothetical protein
MLKRLGCVGTIEAHGLGKVDEGAERVLPVNEILARLDVQMHALANSIAGLDAGLFVGGDQANAH